MIINWYGEGCFKVQSGEATIVTDPFESTTGLTPPRGKLDVILRTINPFPPDGKGTEIFSLIGAGEYNLQNINISGFSVLNESTDKFLKTIYLVEAENLKLVFLGCISETPEPSLLEHIDEVDILFIPGGGKPFIDQKSAVKVIKTLEPSIVLPSFFRVPGLKRQASDLKTFFDEFNHKQPETQEKLTIKRKDVSEIKSTHAVVLSP